MPIPVESELKRGNENILVNVGSDDDVHVYDVRVSTLSARQGGVVGRVCVIRDISEHIRNNRRLRESLQEKDSLLKEIHHRVKNNLQVVSSLLHLQSTNIDDPKLQAALKESQNRVHSMALVHEALYQSENIDRVDFAQYSRMIAESLARSYGIDDSHINLVYETVPVYLDIDAAIPCGLLLNEFVTNSLKHAFPAVYRTHSRENTITVIIRQYEGDVRLSVADNGVGMSNSRDYRSAETLGLQLVNSLVEQ